MTTDTNPVNATIAPLKNVQLFSELVARVLNRSPSLPGMACFHGPSGYGKSFAAIYAANKHRAYHVQVKSVWSRKKLCESILLEMGIPPAKTIADMVDQIGMQLSQSGRPLIVDEANELLIESKIKVIHDIYESCHGTILLIGEEILPIKLKQFERVDGRMLDWVAAEPATMADARHLAKLYCRNVPIADDLLTALAAASKGSARRICVNLDRIREAYELSPPPDGVAMNRAAFKGEFFSGIAPMRAGRTA